MLREELGLQRRFLSSDEERVLLAPASYENEEDLALDRVKDREHAFQFALRDRFLRDGRPQRDWWSWVKEAATEQGHRDRLDAIVLQVLDWSARTSDQAAMLGGFAATALLWFALATLVLALEAAREALFVGVPLAGAAAVVMLAFTVLLWLASRAIRTRTDRHVAALQREYKS